MRLVGVKEYARMRGKEYIRVLKWFKGVGLIIDDVPVYVTLDYDEAVRKLIPEERRRKYMFCAGFCYTGGLGRSPKIIAINRVVAPVLKYGELNVFVHELAHASTLEYIFEWFNVHEDWAEAVEDYIELVFDIEKETRKKIRRNPLEVINYPLSEVIGRMLKFSRKRILSEEARKFLRYIAREIAKYLKEVYEVDDDSNIKSKIVILRVIVRALNGIILREGYEKARKLLTYILYTPRR